MSSRFHLLSALVATLVVSAAIAWGFVQIGSPGSRRLERVDEQRLNDLQTIAREIQYLAAEPTASAGSENRYKAKAPLPKTLEELASSARNERINLLDPETNKPYTYTVKDKTTYELCAVFARPRNEDRSVFWDHPAGQHCFTINVLDPPPYW